MSSKMLFYILKRILLALLTIWIVITVTFFVMHAVPGNPFAGEKSLPQETLKILEAKFGLDKPLMQQYVEYLRDIIFHFDFGPSIKLRGREVIDIILDGMKTSAALGLIAAGAATLVGVVLVLTLGRKEMGLVLSAAVCAMIAVVAMEYLDPVLDTIFDFSYYQSNSCFTGNRRGNRCLSS